MAKNELLPFADGEDANVLPTNQWEALTDILENGFQSGIARSEQVNRVLAQGAVASYVLGQLIVDQLNKDATLDKDTLYQNIVKALQENAKDACLPLSGGTLTGTISYTGTVFAKKTTNNSSIVFLGGSDWGYGSYLELCGSEHSSNPSGFLIQSRLNGNTVSFQGTNSGSLKWNAKEIERVSSRGTGYIRYESGLQICFGDVSPTSSGVQVTYGAPFKDPWARILISTTAGIRDAPTTKTAHYISSANKTATGFKAYSNLNIYADWLAIGWWK